MEFERFQDRVAAGIHYIPAVEHLHAAKNQYRPRSIGKNGFATDQQYLPLLQVSLDVNVVNTSSRTILTHLFSNDNDEAIPEATYSFPLYDGSTVVSFTCWIGGVTIVGSIEAKTKAQERYQEAISRRDVVTLLQEHTSEIFEISLGNIPAQTDVRIEITYVNELKADVGGEGVLVTIPTSVAPRYGTPPEDYAKTANSNSSLKARDGMEICIEVSTPIPIRKLECRTHPISVELGSAARPILAKSFGDLAAKAGTTAVENSRARATLSSSTPVLGRDFVLLILVRGSGLLNPRAVMESCPRHPRFSAIQVAFTPQDLFFSQLPQESFKAEVIFIADRSGSMNTKISALRRSLGIFLQSIPKDGFHFNIASFGSTCSLLWPQSKQYNQDTLNSAHQHLGDSFDADMGGTELLAAIKKVVESRLTNTDLSTEILILTDGEVWDVDATVDYVRSTRDKLGERIRFFALDIGDAVSHKLVEGVGYYGGGFAEVLAVSSPGSWDSRVIRMLKGALSPSSWTCQVTTKPEQGQLSATNSNPKSGHAACPSRSCIKAPYETPSLLSFIHSINYFLVEDSIRPCESVTIHGVSSGGQNATVEIPIERVEASEPTILHLAAKAILTDIETGKSQLHYEAAQKFKPNSSAMNAYIRMKEEQIGKKWSITGRVTSFIGTSSSNLGNHLTRIYQANRVELAELTEVHGAYQRGHNAIHGAHSAGEDDATDDEDDSNDDDDDDDGSNDDKSMSDRDDSDRDNGDYGNVGDDSGDARHDSDGENRGSRQGSDGNERDRKGGEGSGDDVNDGMREDNRGHGVRGDNASRNNHSDDEGVQFYMNRRRRKTHGARNWGGWTRSRDEHSSENRKARSRRQTGVEDNPKIPFLSTCSSAGNAIIKTVSDDQVGLTLSDESKIDSQKRQWFQPGCGISREVITAEIACHFGPAATVRMGTSEDVQGYWVTGNRDPDIELVQSLKIQTEKWEEEIKNRGSLVAYLLSKTYRSNHADGSRSTAVLPQSSPSGSSVPNLHSSVGGAPRPEFRSIVNCYEHSGSFSDSPEATMIFNQLLHNFKPETQSVMRSKLDEEPNHLSHLSGKICKTVISTAYVEKAYPYLDGIWELVVRKADAWISCAVHSSTVKQELKHIASANWIGTEINNDDSFDIEEKEISESSRLRHNSASPNSYGLSPTPTGYSSALSLSPDLGPMHLSDFSLSGLPMPRLLIECDDLPSPIIARRGSDFSFSRSLEPLPEFTRLA